MPIEHLGRHPLALDHPEPRQNSGAKSLQIMRDRAPTHLAEPHGLLLQAKEDSEPKKQNVWGLYLQGKVPTVRNIQVGRGALMRVRKPKKELVGSWVRRVVFFFG